MGPPIGRRRFILAGTAGAGLLAAGAAGCSSAAKTIRVNPRGAGTAVSGQPDAFTVLPDTFDYFAGIDQRIAVALATSAGDPIHPSGPVTIQIGPIDQALGAPVTAAVHGEGLANPYLLAYHHFDAPGTYTLRVSYQGKHSDMPIQVTLASASPIPSAGKAMISVPTPTTANPLGVNPVCTRQPPCPFHAVSLDMALSQHRRVALLFATPALCQSRFCGPVLDNLIATHTPFADQVTFIHCEIYTDLGGQTTTAPVTAYHLEHEPMLLLAGTDGIVVTRVDNAFDRVEASDALGRLVRA